MPLQDWRKVIRMAFPEVRPVTARTKHVIFRNRSRMRGSMRIATGRIWETDAYEKRRARVLSTALP